MQILEVINKERAKAFIELPKKLYKNDPDWICPLDNDIKAIFDPRKNSFFSHGECIRWILMNPQQEVIGRIAAFINHQKTINTTMPTGGIGFFEVIKDQSAAFHLFDTAKQWLTSKGMYAMEGPVNFGENDKYWGLLVEGFKPPQLRHEL